MGGEYKEKLLVALIHFPSNSRHIKSWHNGNRVKQNLYTFDILGKTQKQSNNFLGCETLKWKAATVLPSVQIPAWLPHMMTRGWHIPIISYHNMSESHVSRESSPCQTFSRKEWFFHCTSNLRTIKCSCTNRKIWNRPPSGFGMHLLIKFTFSVSTFGCSLQIVRFPQIQSIAKPPPGHNAVVFCLSESESELEQLEGCAMCISADKLNSNSALFADKLIG